MLIAITLRLVLAFPDTTALDATIVRYAIGEAAGIWAPYGIVIEGVGTAKPPADAPLLTVAVISTPAATREAVVLGTIEFGADGVPEPRITLRLDEILRFVAAARIGGAAEWQWPRLLREQVVGRVLGRVLAHEIGHYVLSSRQHTSSGLMRSVQRSDELAAPSRRGFTLSPADAAQLPYGLA